MVYSGLGLSLTPGLIISDQWNALIITYDGNKNNGSNSFEFYTVDLNTKLITNVSFNIVQNRGNYNNNRSSGDFNIGRNVRERNSYFNGNIASLSSSSLVDTESEKELKKFKH